MAWHVYKLKIKPPYSVMADVTPQRERLLSSNEIDENQTSSLARCLAAAVFIAPWVWVIAFSIAYDWAVDDIATRHKHARDMPMGATIHAFGFFIMSLPATHIIGACVFAPFVASPYLRYGVSIIPLCFFGVGLGIASGRLAAASMDAPIGPDYDAVVRAFVFASICFYCFIPRNDAREVLVDMLGPLTLHWDKNSSLTEGRNHETHRSTAWGAFKWRSQWRYSVIWWSL